MDTVNTTETAQAGQLLEEMRYLYGTLRDMTRRFLNAFSIPALQDLLKERSKILFEIDADEERLLEISDVESLKQYGAYGEITNHIAAILSCDREIAERVKSDMRSVSRELSSLSAASSAALTYTRQAKC
jgi:hypothetical protein